MGAGAGADEGRGVTREPLREITVPAGYTIADFGKGRGGGYFIDGEKVVGVTTALGIIDGGKSGGMAWSAARIWLEGACSLVGKHRVDWDDVAAVEAELKSRKLLHIHKWGDKADLGTSIHSALELLCDGTVPVLASFPEEERPYIRAICGWYADNDPVVIEQEMMVGSKVHGFAGRFDLLYRQGGQLVLGDLKTSKTVQPTHLVQLAAYRLALAECGYGYGVDRMEVIHARPDGSYGVIESKAIGGDFLNILAAYRSYNSNKDDLKAAA